MLTARSGTPLTVAKSYQHPELVEYLHGLLKTYDRSARKPVSKPNFGPSLESLDIEVLWPNGPECCLNSTRPC